jgi:hypothetical protein
VAVQLTRAFSYFASKTCTYTDASGRPVPAPRPFKLDRPDPQQDSRQPVPSTLHTPQVTNGYPAPQLALQQPMTREGDNEASRKRFRSEQGNRLAPTEPLLLIPETGPSLLGHGEHPAGLDNSLIRELVNRANICLFALHYETDCSVQYSSRIVTQQE